MKTYTDMGFAARGMLAVALLPLLLLPGCGGGGYGGGTTTPPTVIPSVPTGLTATPGNANISLSWTSSAGAVSYHLKRATVSGGPYTLGASPNGTSVSDSSVTNGTTYFYVVSALNSAGESANSAEVSAAPVAPITIPATPTNLVATGGNAQASLTWSSSTGATSYRLKRATTSGGP